jgi:hypothetical protein
LITENIMLKTLNVFKRVWSWSYSGTLLKQRRFKH